MNPERATYKPPAGPATHQCSGENRWICANGDMIDYLGVVRGHIDDPQRYESTANFIRPDNRTMAEITAQVRARQAAQQSDAVCPVITQAIISEGGPVGMKREPQQFIDSLTSAERKEVAMFRGLMAYFPNALALIARHSARSNEKHNPGQPLHWSKGKSSDHDDCVIRHSASIAIDPESKDDGQYHMVCRGWRALAALEIWAEDMMKKHGRIE